MKNIGIDELQDVIQMEEGSANLSKLTNQLIQYDSLGIMEFDGKVKLGDTIGDGVEHEEFYADESSILATLRKIMDLREEDE